MLTLFTAVGHLTMQKTEYGKRPPLYPDIGQRQR